jgi:aryl-alcohol dehydrogenase-like predicted oxidoreductase
MMKKQAFGKTGMEVTRLGLGTWGLGGIYYGKVPFEQGVQAVRAYLDAGGRLIDTAYSYHQSEEVIGAAIQPYRREELFITSKTYAGCFADRDDLASVRTHCEISLRDLGTDYLDHYMVHGTPSSADHLHRVLDEFDKLKAAGKIRSIGCSIRGPCVNDESLQTALTAVETGRIDAIQLTYSIVRQKHAAVFEAARQNGVAVIVRWVLESGMLSGKYEPGHEFIWPDTRNRYRPDERDTILRTGQALKDQRPAGFDNPVQLAVAFALAHPAVTGLIMGSNTADQARRNAALDSLPPLPAETLSRLQQLYGPLNDRCNPTGEFEHVDSPRRPLEE